MLQKQALYNKIAILISIFSILVAVGMYTFYSVNISALPQEVASNLNEGWTYIDSEKNEKDFRLPFSTVSLLKGEKKEEFTMFRNLPEEISEDEVLVLHIMNQNVNVSVDGVSRYDYKKDSAISKLLKARPESLIYITLSPEDSGKKIEINYQMPYGLRSQYLAGTMLGQRYACDRLLKQGQTPLLIACILLGAIAGFAKIISLIYAKGSRQREVMHWLSVFVFAVAIRQILLYQQSGVANGYLDIISIMANYAIIFIGITSIQFGVSILKYATKDPRSLKYINYLYYGFALYIPVAVLLYYLTDLDADQIIGPAFFLGIAMCVEFFRISPKMTRNGKYYKIAMLLNVCFSAAWVSEAISHMNVLARNRFATLIAWDYAFISLTILLVILRMVYIGIEQSNAMKKQIMEGQVQLMLSQIRPHFIYNALNSIHILIKKDPDTACNMVTNFSAYLRANMNAMGENKLATFRQELEHIKAYTEIEKVRFPKVEVIFEIDEIEFSIPVLTVEPLVENAIKHGVAKKREGGLVRIRAYRSGRYIYIEVLDNGIGFDTRILQAETESLGIRNVRYRIESVMDGELYITSEIGKGSIAQIKLPIKKAKGEEEE